MLLACFVFTANAQRPPSIADHKAAAIIDKIARSLPESDGGWTLTASESYRRDDGSTQASLHWTNGTVELAATVFVHTTVAKAKGGFRPSGKEDVQEGFRIDGVGDEAFLWPPKTPAGGAYNIRFRKAQVEVWMSGVSEEEVKRYARIIAASISPN
jgi:hypothetical protein